MEKCLLSKLRTTEVPGVWPFIKELQKHMLMHSVVKLILYVCMFLFDRMPERAAALG